MGKSVLLDWVTDLEFTEQTGLISVIRGMDNVDPDVSEMMKKIIRPLRALILNNANDRTNFMSNEIVSQKEIIVLCKKLEQLHLQTMAPSDDEGVGYNSHWLEHIKLALKIICKKHPDPYVRQYWGMVRKELNDN